MRGVVKFALLCLLAVGTGLLSAQYAVDGNAALFTHSTGAWITWPKAGTADADPYTRTHYLLRGKLPISSFEATELEAYHDDAGRQLQSDCTYTLRGAMPQSRWWSIALSGAGTGSSDRTSLSSLDAIYEPDDTIVISISREPQPGNWIPLELSGDFRLSLRLYNTGRVGRKAPPAQVFSIKREVCR